MAHWTGAVTVNGVRGFSGTQFEQVLGATLATALLLAINSAIGVLVPLPTAISFVALEIVSFIVSALANRNSIIYGRFGRKVSYPNRAWRLFFGSVGGIAFGKWIIGPLLASAPALSQPTAVLSPFVPIDNLGRAGGAVVLIKQLYLLVVKLSNGQTDIELLGPAISAIAGLASMDISTTALSVVLGIGLVSIRKGLEYAKYSAGITAKGVRSTDGRNPYIENFFGSFDETALSILGLGSVFANPMLLVSVMVSWINKSIRRGALSGSDFKEVFAVYSGVPISIMIMSEGLKWISSFSGANEVSHSIGALMFTIPSGLMATLGCLYYGSHPKVLECIRKAWDYSSLFLMSIVKGVSKIIRRLVVVGLGWIGKQFGEGIMQNLPAWMRPASDVCDPIQMGEVFAFACPEPVMVNKWMYCEWLAQAGLTSIQRLYYSSTIANPRSSGSVPTQCFRNFVSKHGSEVSFAWKSKAAFPIELTRLTSRAYYHMIRQYSLDVELEGECISMKRGGASIKLESASNDDVTVVWFGVTSSLGAFGILMVCVPAGQESVIYLIGFKVSSGLVRQVLDSLIRVHPLLKAMEKPEKIERISDMK